MYNKKFRRGKLLVFVIISFIVSSFSFFSFSASNEAHACQKNDINNWMMSEPEQQGMSSSILSNMFKAIDENNAPVHSVVVVKNGKIVTEAYVDPYEKNVKHELYSATKSITSTLIGIAISEGYIKGVDQKVLEFFPEIDIEDDQYHGKDITIENLLTMSSGLRDDSTQYVFLSPEFPKAFFSVPFSSKPGTKYYYDSGVSHMLSYIITRSTGMSVNDYAKKHLFDPMGITDYSWDVDLAGVNIGGFGLRLMPRDMAKFGQLVLNWGEWNGKQLIPKQWLEVATSKHIDAYWGDIKGDGYGYQWWMNFFGGYRADGYGGQNIYVMPDKDLVVVFTGGFNNTEAMQSGNYVNDYIIPSIKSNKPLQKNPKALSQLKDLIKKLQDPKPEKVCSLPQIAKVISDKTFKMNYGDMSFSLSFKNKNSCVMKLKQNGTEFMLPVGMDGRYCVSEASKVGTMTFYPNYDKVALKGSWINANTFEMTWHYVGEPFSDTYKFVFNDKEVSLEINKYLADPTGISPMHLAINGTLE